MVKHGRTLPNPQPGWALYLRTSDKEVQNPANSQSRQRNAFRRALLETADLPVIGEYIDNQTGRASERREGYQHLLRDARGWARPFFEWYNHQHYHTGLNLLTPTSVHYGQAEIIRQHRQAVLAAAYAQHPQRLVHGEPLVKGAPAAVWINPPTGPNLP